MNEKITLGSLFDGSGTMPLCATEEADGLAVWASEVEPYPIAVTSTHLPHMRHLGSVLDINGAEIEPVDVITFGSPCQDLSVAGRRAGLEGGGRSSLFLEAIRIIKEMHEATSGQYPQIVIWENVLGAFSSNGGKDFERVLNELLHISRPDEFICKPDKWAKAADYGAVAYRTVDAQFWGVPQRRRRIYAVADIAGECAGKISFELQSLRGHTAASREQGQDLAADTARCTDSSNRAQQSGPVFCLQGNGIDRGDESGCNGKGVAEDVSYTLNTCDRHAVAYDAPTLILDDQGGACIRTITNGISPRLRAQIHGHPPCVVERQQQSDLHVFSFDSLSSNSMKSSNPASGCREVAVAKCIDTGYPSPDKNQGGIAVVHVFESHPQDARIKDCGSVAPTCTAKFAKGTADTPLVLEGYQEPTAFHLTQDPISSEGLSPCISSGNSKAGQCTVGVCETYAVDTYNQTVSDTMQSLRAKGCADHVGCVCEAYAVENHPQDSRVKISDDGIVQTLSSQMGMGGGNVPLVIYRG